MLTRWTTRVALVILIAGPARSGPLHAQGAAPPESVTVVPGAQYRAGGVHRFFFGSRYRALWTSPIRVPVLDLKTFAGGLTPVQRGGGMQTSSLRFKGGDGKEYAFRSVAKDPSPLLPPELRQTVAGDIVRDQVSASHPVAALVAAPLLAAAGVLHATPTLAHMPDDPALGEYRKEFGGVLGMIEERPRELGDESLTFAGAREIVGTAELFQELDKTPDIRVDGRAFLLARLADLFMGDWDRHADQWRWARIARNGAESWQPIPRDRDQAFVRLDGFLLAQARRSSPQLVNFGPAYSNILGATWNGRNLDRRFLTGLERPVWDSVAALLQDRLTDQVIAGAVRQMPREYYALDGARLEAALKTRRDGLPDMAARYYRHLASVVDIYTSDKADSARVTRRTDGLTEIAVVNRGTAYYRRVFDPNETREVRLLMQGGADHVAVDGADERRPTVRVLGGGGDDLYAIARSAGAKLYDDRGSNTAAGAGINRRAWRWRADSSDGDIRILPPRDWGRKTILLASGFLGPDVEAVLGYSGHTEWYGFRRVPYATRVDYGLEISTGKSSGRARIGLTRQFENSGGYLEATGLASGIEMLRWYGFGNGTKDRAVSRDAGYHRLSQSELSFGLKVGMRFGKRHLVTAGPLIRWSDTDLGSKHNANRFIAADRPYGIGRFGLIGLGAELLLEGRDYPKFATRGAALSVRAESFAGAWDADEGVGRVDAQSSVALAPAGSWQPSLNLMAGGSVTWGAVPFFLAPTLGGMRTLRGYRPDRFAGESSIYGSAEVRLPLSRLKLVVPGQQGVYAFYDVGRVYNETVPILCGLGEDSDDWHTSIGGGVWFSFLGRSSVMYAGAGKPTKGREGARFLLGFGFPH
ncbi:MAG: BamA/TamA family outer membrane protein [Gemmatimonadales bacterium]|nr:BamA/TamA family outer membrane protein [Gemmatimonadales bacterium]